MNNYIVLKTINKGEFGEIKMAKNKYTNKLVAIKIEKKLQNTLTYESRIYQYLSKIDNIPKLRHFITDTLNNYLIIDLLDYNLILYKKENNNIDNIDNIFILITKLLTILKNIHEMGIVHRDIKPENICFKNKEPFLIDFGMAKHIIKNNNHINEKNINSLIGTPNYVSINVINLIEPTRRDDIESIVYLLIFLLLDDSLLVKYHNLSLQDKKNIEIIHLFIDVIKINNEYKSKIINYLDYCRKLEFSNKPNYNYIINLFKM